MITWGYASSIDIDRYYAGRPHETLRAIVIRLDGEPAGIIGLAKEPDRDRAFSEYKPMLEPHLKSMTILRAIKAFMGWVHASSVPIYAFCEGPDRILSRLGFQQIDGEFYAWLG